MTYDPRKYEDRVRLADAIVEALEAKGFVDDGNELVGELVLTREIGDTGVTVHVYTAVERQWHDSANGRRQQTRRAGTDAIRVAATFEHNGEARGLVKTTRINRVGTVADIVGRMMRRTKEVWHKAQHPERCPRCGAPRFVSKRGNAVCADFCWKEGMAERRRAERSA